jgi:hypothetical protein
VLIEGYERELKPLIGELKILILKYMIVTFFPVFSESSVGLVTLSEVGQ